MLALLLLIVFVRVVDDLDEVGRECSSSGQEYRKERVRGR